MSVTSAALTGGKVIALLRAVNVGGRTLVKMDQLRGLLERLGYIEPRTLLQSGNAVFGVPSGSGVRNAAALETQIEDALQQRLSLQADVFIRSADEWDAVIARNPFAEQASSDPARLVVMTLRDAPSISAVKALQSSIKGGETVRGRERHLYIVYPDGQGRSKFTGNVIERALGTRGTARNWNTVVKLATMARS
jgi:uncharacterized protein (DUF1697 family)